MKKNLFWLLLFFSLPQYLSAQILINEICPANADINYDTDYYNFSGWVELYNAGTTNVNISGYYLSDKFADKTKWQIPSTTVIAPKGFVLIWCDEMNNRLHTNFGLDAEGEELILSNTSGVLVDKLEFPVQFTNISFGRTTDGAAAWSYLLNPTPKAKNNSETATERLSKPSFSVSAGKYPNAQTLTLSASNGATIRYTTDGSEPNASSAAYSSALIISQTKTVKAKAYLDGYIPSETTVATYFINVHAFTFPVVSLTTQATYLWDNTIGIYGDGTNGIPGNCNGNPMNWNQDWDRHASFELFGDDGKRLFNQAVDIRIGGACSRNFPQKSFVVKARDKYGSNIMQHRFFDNKGAFKYGGVQLNNSGNDFNVTQFRDAILQSITIGQMDLDYMAYQPAVLYLNGQYWGIQNLREKIDADYFETNYGIKKDDLDLIEFQGDALEGTSDAYWNYLNTLQSLDRSQSSTFDFIDDRIDVQEYINYLSTEIYYANTDWPGNNQKFWRQRSTNGKFRWILWDLDFGFGVYQDASYPTHPTLYFATDPNGPGWPNPDWATLPIRLVLDNPTFRTLFVQTLVANMNTTFKPERIIDFLDSFQTRIQTEMPYHKQRWGGDMGGWNYEVQRMRDFGSQRYVFMQDHIADFFDLGEKVRLDISAGESNSFKINQVLADRPIENGIYYKGLSLNIEAAPSPGYTFSHWEITERKSSSVSMITQGDVWKYSDKGIDLGTAWRATNYDDTSWNEGNAQLGYAEGDEQTVLSFGPDESNKFITSYFRKTFSIEDTAGLDGLNSSALFDDGIVVYINGTEVYRNNMPEGDVTFSTLAPAAVSVENAFSSVNIPKGVLVSGQNVVAVEIHQNSPQSSDISFDFTLNGVIVGEEQTYSSQQILVMDTAQSDISMQAFFETAPSFNGLVINEFSATNTSLLDNFNEAEDWIELYNSSSETINLSGLYITDDLINPTKYQIPSSNNSENIIAPGDYKILWADEELAEGSLHLPFKLSASGEQLGIYQMVQNVLYKVDEVTFGIQNLRTSTGRYPNANGPFVTTGKITPGEENQLAEPLAIGELEGQDLIIYPNPTIGNITLKSSSNINQIKIYDSKGQLVRHYSELGMMADLNIDDLGTGLYLFIINSADKTEARRIIKN